MSFCLLSTVTIMSLNQYLCPLCLFYAMFIKCIKQLLTVAEQSQVSFHAVEEWQERNLIFKSLSSSLVH